MDEVIKWLEKRVGSKNCIHFRGGKSRISGKKYIQKID